MRVGDRGRKRCGAHRSDPRDRRKPLGSFVRAMPGQQFAFDLTQPGLQIQDLPGQPCDHLCGPSFTIAKDQIDEVLKVVVFLGRKTLPEDCWHKRFHESRIADFIHIVAMHDYLGILEKLRVPEDIRRYFAYREKALRRQREEQTTFAELDIMGPSCQT